jgi:hypothetical protein
MDHCGHRTRYCYAERILAEQAMDAWDGEGDPLWWHKHPDSGRRQHAFRWGATIMIIENGQIADVVVPPVGMSDEQIAALVQAEHDKRAQYDRRDA